MSADQTRSKILNAAIELFNERGLANVRLQHIADRAGLSVGNLAYHYRTKKALVTAVHDALEGLIEPLLSREQTFPHLIDFDNQLSQYYHLSREYSFYFLDLLEIERGYPQIHASRLVHLQRLIDQIADWLKFAVDKHLLMTTIGNRYSGLAEIIWMIIHFWHHQVLIREQGDNEGKFKAAVWAVLEPHLTEVGRSEYQALIIPNMDNFIN